MKRLLLVVLLAGCAAPPTQEQQLMQILHRYGPRCGLDMANLPPSMPPAEQQRVVRCIEALVAVDQAHIQQRAGFQESLSRGLRDAGQIMGDGSPGVRYRDFRCYADCSTRYSAPYCSSLCSY